MSWLVVAAGFGFAAVTAGAFGAHGLRDTVSPERLAAWQTASSYALVHALALLALALHSSATGKSIAVPASLFAAGIALFSGSIFGLVLFEWRVLGPVTPLGGLCLLAGWGSLAWWARAA